MSQLYRLQETILLILTTLLFLPFVVAETTTTNDPLTFFDTNDNTDAYLTWLESSSSRYSLSAFYPVTDGAQGAAVHWKVDDTLLHVAVAVKATGWVSFGISENGGMKGADIVTYTVATDTLVDGYILDDLQPRKDCQQDWNLVEVHTDDDDFLIVEMNRKLDTQDDQDRAIFEDGPLSTAVSRVILAWGDDEEQVYHGPTKRSKGGIRFYGDGMDEVAAFRDLTAYAQSFELRSRDKLVKMTTEYIQICLTWSDIVAQGVPADQPISVFAFEPIIENVGNLYVQIFHRLQVRSLCVFRHHFHVGGGTSGMDGKSCDEFGEVTHGEMAYGWAHGEPSLIMPDNVGMYVGPGHFQSFRMVIHYENPQQDPNLTDSSGLRFHYTTEMRPLEFSVLRLGDVNIVRREESLGLGKSTHAWECPSDCTNSVMAAEEVNVIRSYIHMHSSGRYGRNEVIRDGKVVQESIADFFDFDQQGNQAIQQKPFKIKKGDAFRTVCGFFNDGNRTFGESAEQEMCVAFLSYYPKQSYLDLFPFICAPDIPYCKPEYATEDNLDDFPRVFGAAQVCASTAVMLGSALTTAAMVVVSWMIL